MPDETPSEAGPAPRPRIVKTVRRAREATGRSESSLEPRPAGDQQSSPGHRGDEAAHRTEQHGHRRNPTGEEAVSPERRTPVDRSGRAADQRSGEHPDRTGDSGRSKPQDSGADSHREADATGRRASDPRTGRSGKGGRRRTPDPRSADGRDDRRWETERTRDADSTGHRDQSGDEGRDGEEPRRAERDRSADGTGGHRARDADTSGSGRRRPPDPTGADRDADNGGNGHNGRATDRARRRTRNLSTVGPFVTRFEGRVHQVFGTSQRPRPSLAPLVAGVIAVVFALALPYVLAWSPIIVLVAMACLWLGRRSRLRGGHRLPRGGGRPEAGLQVTSFRVQVYDNLKPFRSLDCRFVQSSGAGPAPLVGDELVVGQGYRLGRGLVEVRTLRVGGSQGTRLRAAHLRSSISVALPALLLLGAAAGLVYSEWDLIEAFQPRVVGASVAQALIIFTVLVVVIRFFRSRLRL